MPICDRPTLKNEFLVTANWGPFALLLSIESLLDYIEADRLEDMP